MEKIIFEDLPSTKTPLNAENLNNLQNNIETYVNNNINELNNFFEEKTERINNKFNYSTEEQLIGIWFGKPLYRKTIVLDNIKEEQNLEIDNIDTIFINSGHSYISWGDNSYSYPIGRANFSIFKPKGTIKAENAEQLPGSWFGKITVEYTKTTD